MNSAELAAAAQNEPLFIGLLSGLSEISGLYSTSGKIQVTQLIYSQSYWVGLKTSQKALELYELLKNKTEEDVLEEVATSYYQTLTLMLQLKTIEKSMVNLQEMHRIVELNYKNDLTKETNVNRLKVTISNLDANKQTVKNVIDIQLNYIKALAGMPADTSLRLDTCSINNFISQTNPAFTVENVPAYQVLMKQSDLNMQKVKLEKAKYFPTIAAYGQMNYSSYSTKAEINDLSNMSTIGVKLSVPIFTSGVTNARIKQAQLKLAQSKEDILKTKDLLTVSYNNAISEYQTSVRLLDAQKENCDLALKVYNQTSLQYKEGMVSMADLLNVNSDYLQAENSYNQQILKCRLSEVKMLKTSGNLKQFVNKN